MKRSQGNERWSHSLYGWQNHSIAYSAAAHCIVPSEQLSDIGDYVFQVETSMKALNCSGFLESLAKWSNAIKVDQEEANPNSIVYTSYGRGYLAVATGTVMTIATSTGTTFENVVDIELDNIIDSVCWGDSASCLIAADVCGSLHFITPSGELLFSHRILPSK